MKTPPSSVEDLSVCIVRPVMMSIWNNFERKAVGIRGFVGLCGRSRCSNRPAGCRGLSRSPVDRGPLLCCVTLCDRVLFSSRQIQGLHAICMSLIIKELTGLLGEYVLALYQDTVLRKMLTTVSSYRTSFTKLFVTLTIIPKYRMFNSARSNLFLYFVECIHKFWK